MTDREIHLYLERRDFREKWEIRLSKIMRIVDSRVFQVVYGFIGFALVMVIYHMVKNNIGYLAVTVFTGVLFFMTGALMVVMIAGCAWRAYLERLGGWK